MDNEHYNDGIRNEISNLLKLSADEPASISWIRESLEDAGWRGLGNAGIFEEYVQELGFTLRRKYGKQGNVTRTYVEEITE